MTYRSYDDYQPEGPDPIDPFFRVSEESLKKEVADLREFLNQRSNERDQAEKLLGVSVGILHRSEHDGRRDPPQCNFLICQQASKILPPGAFS